MTLHPLPESFETVYRDHYKRVYCLCMRMLRNHEDAEDLAQDTFILVERHMHKFRGECAFTSWLHRVTVSAVLMHFRRKKAKRIDLQLSIDDPDIHTSVRETAARTPSVSMNIALKEAVRQLPDGYRNTLLLHDLEGYEHEDVAKLIGCSVGTSKSQLHKAKSVMRKLLNKKANPRIHRKELSCQSF